MISGHTGQFYRPNDDYDMDGASLLMYACARPTPDHLRIVNYLLDKLAVDAHQCDTKQRDALFYACQHCNTDAATLVLAKLDAVRRDAEGRTPLMVAAANGCLAACQLLVSSARFGAELCDLKDAVGRGALHYWAMNGKECGLLDVLAGHTADLDARDVDGMTPTMYACAGGHAYTLLTLLRRKVSVSVLDARRRSALHYCFRKLAPSIKCVKLLLKYGTNVNHADVDGVTSLMLAAQSCAKSDISLVKCMLDYGADPVAQDAEGKDAYDYCPFDAEYVKALMRDKAGE